MPPRIALVPRSVRKVCQLTGEYDRERQTYAFNRAESRFGFFGTDLGSSFEHGNRMWFLFGEPGLAWPGTGERLRQHRLVDRHDARTGLHLDFVARGDRYRSPRLGDRDGNDLSTAGFEVPIAGFSANDQMYVFYSPSHVSQQASDGGLDVFWVGPDGVTRGTWANPGMGGANWHEQYPIGPSAGGCRIPGARVSPAANTGPT